MEIEYCNQKTLQVSKTSKIRCNKRHIPIQLWVIIDFNSHVFFFFIHHSFVFFVEVSVLWKFLFCNCSVFCALIFFEWLQYGLRYTTRSWNYQHRPLVELCSYARDIAVTLLMCFVLMNDLSLFACLLVSPLCSQSTNFISIYK